MIICTQPSYNFAHISLAAGSTGRIGQSSAFLSEKEFGRRRAIEAQQEFCFLRTLERDPLSRNSAHSGIYRGTLLTGANAEGLRQMQSVGLLCRGPGWNSAAAWEGEPKRVHTNDPALPECSGHAHYLFSTRSALFRSVPCIPYCSHRSNAVSSRNIMKQPSGPPLHLKRGEMRQTSCPRNPTLSTHSGLNLAPVVFLRSKG